MEQPSIIVRNKAYEEIIQDLERYLNLLQEGMNKNLSMSSNYQKAMNDIGHEYKVLSLKFDITQKQLVAVREEYDNQGS